MPEPAEAFVTHDPAETNGAAHTPAPRPHEEDTWRWLSDLADDAAKVRREEARFDDFDHSLDIYYGKHWPSSLPSFRPPIVANELRTLILSEASDLTETQLRVYITKDPKNAKRDEQVERAFRAVWARQQVDLKLLYSCVWALTVGTGFIGVDWDPDEAGGLGDIIVRDVDPRFVLPDPDAIDDKTWRFRMIEQVMDIAEIRRLFPQSGWRVRPEDRFSIRDTSRDSSRTASSPAYTGPMNGNDSLMGGTPGYKKARARLIDCMVQDDKTETVVEEVKGPDEQPIRDENGNPKLKQITKAKYPRGRRIIGANGVILSDGGNPNPGGDFGLARVILEPTLGRFWSSGFVQQTSEIQLAADKGLSNNVENSIRLNNGIVIATTNTGLDWETFAGIPAQIVQINPGSEFKIQYPPPMPPDMVQFPLRMLDLQRRILGFPDSRAGAPGKGNVSPDLTETEISQAQGPTRLRARLLYHTVQRVAEMIFARMAWGYTTQRAIPAVEGEQFKPVEWEPLQEPEKYALYVDPASFNIMSRTALRRLAIAAYKLRGIDRKALLEMLGFPDAEQIAKRMDDAERMQAMAKMAAKKGK